MRVRIEFELYDEYVDLEDSTGMNVSTFEHVNSALMEVGDDVQIERID